MCKFFSCISNGQGKIWYFDSTIRKKIISGKLKYDTDSHTSIADYYGFKGEKEDKMNKYEYNPLTRELTIDQLNTVDDSESVKKQCLELDFKTIVPELQIKELINPFNIAHGDTVNETEIDLLKKWSSVRSLFSASVSASVGDSVWDSVWYSVWYSVRDLVSASVGDSVWDSVWYSVRDLVRDLVGDSVWDSVWYSVWYSVRDLVGDSVLAYTSSFYTVPSWNYVDHEPGINPFQPCIDLWELGLVPSFSGTTWRLHSGRDAKIIYEWRR